MDGLNLKVFSDSKGVAEHLRQLTASILAGRGGTQTFVVKNPNEIEAVVSEFSSDNFLTSELVIYSFESKELENALRQRC